MKILDLAVIRAGGIGAGGIRANKAHKKCYFPVKFVVSLTVFLWMIVDWNKNECYKGQTGECEKI